MVDSAYLNTPPANHRDYMIAKGMLLNSGITSDIRDPSLGVKLSPSRPDNYNFETRGPGIIAGLSICIAIMTVITILRLGLRFWIPRLKWGLDDTLMVPGLVSCHYCLPLTLLTGSDNGFGLPCHTNRHDTVRRSWQAHIRYHLRGVLSLQMGTSKSRLYIPTVKLTICS